MGILGKMAKSRRKQIRQFHFPLFCFRFRICWPKPRCSRSPDRAGHFYQARAHETYSRAIRPKSVLFVHFKFSMFAKICYQQAFLKPQDHCNNERSRFSDSVPQIDRSQILFPTHFVPNVRFFIFFIMFFIKP